MKEQYEAKELTCVRDDKIDEQLSGKGSVSPGREFLSKTAWSSLDWKAILPIVPIPVFLILFLVLALLDIRTVFEPPWLLPASNVLFLFIVPLAVVYIAAQGYLQSGFITLLMLGAGTLAFGLGALLAGSVLSLGGPNANVTVYNFSVLFSAVFHAVGAALAFVGSDPQSDARRKKFFVAFTYLGTTILLASGAIATLKAFIPVFFVQGEGPTVLRQTVLGTAIALFIVSGVLLAGLRLLSRAKLLYWYSLALFLVATGLICVLFQKSVGSPIGWLGRSSQFLGGVYLLAAVVSARKDLRRKALTIQGGIAGLFRHRLAMRVEERTAQLRRVNEQLSNEVAERKKAEEALHESEHMLRAILSTSPVGIALTKKRKIEWANEVWKHMFGYEDEQDYLGRDARMLYVSDEDYAHAGNLLYHDIETGKVGEADTKLRRKDGSVFDAHVKMKALDPRDPAGGTISAVSDISSRKRAEEALRESEAQKQAILDGITTNIAFVNEDLEIGWVNKTAADSVGKLPSHMIGHKCHEYWADADKPCDGCPTLKAFSTKKSEHAIMVTPDGRVWDERGEPVFDDEGRLVGVVEIAQDITDQKKAKDALQASESFLNSVIDQSPYPMWISDHQGTLERTNKALRDLLMVSDEEIVGKYNILKDNIVEDQGFVPLIKRVFERGETVRFEIKYDTSQLKHIHLRQPALVFLDVTIFPIMDSDGKVTNAVIQHMDITERKTSEGFMRMRLDLLEFAASHSLDELLQKTLDEICALTGSPVGFYHFVASDEKTLSLQAWSTRTANEFCKAEPKGRHFPIDEAGVWADGIRERKPVIHNDYSTLPHRRGMPEGHAAVTRELVVPIMKSDRIVAILGIGNKPTDYTQQDVEICSYLADVAWEIVRRKEVEQGLQDSERRYRTLFEESLDGVYSVFRDGEIADANASFCRLFGYTREEMIGKDINELYFDPADRPRFQKEIEEKGFVKDYELKGRKKDGTEVDCSLASSVYFGEDGSIAGYRGILRDLTTHKALQRQLLQAQKMESIGTLAGGIAHDFNNLLTVVMGFSELLLAEKSEDDREYSDIQKILQAAKNGADLVQRLLTFSRKSEPKPVPLNLNRQIVHVEKLLRRTIPRMIDISLDLSPDLPEIYADPAQVEQVLMNLALNARDAMPDGGKVIVGTSMVRVDAEYSRLHVEAGPGEYVLMEVSDTGHGMDKDTVEHIFEPFFTTKERGRGTGLGLAIVYGIIKQHNGFITVCSEVGRGTAFRVYLPAIPGDEAPEVEDSGVMPAFGTETVLLVDDEELVRELGVRILTKHGYKILQAGNGREALDLFKKERSRISLVILDLIMPEMSGAECLKELLKLDANVKVLVASGYSADSSMRETVQMGAKGFVTKPFRVKELLRDVRRLLDEG